MDATSAAIEFAEKVAPSRGVAIIGSVWSGSIAGLASIVSGDGAVATAIVVAASSVLGALFAKLPDIIKARSDSKKTDETVNEDVRAKLIEQIYRNADRERESKEKQIQKLEAENIILRTTKHEILNDCNVLRFWLIESRDILREHNIQFPPHEMRDIADLIRSEDNAMKQISNIPKNEN